MQHRMKILSSVVLTLNAELLGTPDLPSAETGLVWVHDNGG
jgi:hypothetical protein